MEHILFITSNYPSKSRPYSGVFVQQIVHEIAALGISCTVISPTSFTEKRWGELDKPHYIDNAITNNPVHVYKPKYLSCSNKSIFGFNTFNLTLYNYYKSIIEVMKKNKIKPTYVYGHFLYPSGAASIEVGKKLNIPSIVAVGESGTNIDKTIIKGVGLVKAKKQFKHISKVIAVSTRNKNFCVNELQIPEKKVKVLPNGVNLNLFKRKDKLSIREQLGLPIDKTIVCFTGHYNERKGPHRVLEAIENIENVMAVFIGEGPIELKSNKIIHQGKLEHEKIPDYLNASDIFVLPTLEEGSCNAIIEALACGLPVVSSNCDFNHDIINRDVSIMINPRNINEIREAIIKLKDDKSLRLRMANNALQHSKKFSITVRAKNILNWITKS